MRSWSGRKSWFAAAVMMVQLSTGTPSRALSRRSHRPARGCKHSQPAGRNVSPGGRYRPSCRLYAPRQFGEKRRPGLSPAEGRWSSLPCPQCHPTARAQPNLAFGRALKIRQKGRDPDSSKRFIPCREAAVGYSAGAHSTPSRRHRRRRAPLHDGDIPTGGDTVPRREVQQRPREAEQTAQGLRRGGDAIAAAHPLTVPTMAAVAKASVQASTGRVLHADARAKSGQ